MATASTTARRSQYLTFFMAKEEYAVGILHVREIIQYDTLTCVPGTPPWIRGVINLRGGVVPVVDLAAKLGLPRTSVSRSTCIVITEVDVAGEPTVMGILADAVSQVIELRPEDIETPPSFGTGVRVDYLLGMGRVGKKFVLMLDTEKVLSAEELLLAATAVEPERDAEALETEGDEADSRPGDGGDASAAASAG